VASVSSGSYADDWYPQTCNTAQTVCRDYFAPVTVRPSVATTYRWYYPGSDAVDPAFSATTSVSVRTRLAPTWISAIHRGVRFSITGRTYPAKPGTTVTMWGRIGTTTYKLGYARVSSTGTFKIYGTATRFGTWSVWFTIPPVSGNLSGTSAHRTYSVS
jgi:hypothetical protein